MLALMSGFFYLMILIFEPTPFARSKSLANGVGLFYKDKLIYSLFSELDNL